MQSRRVLRGTKGTKAKPTLGVSPTAEIPKVDKSLEEYKRVGHDKLFELLPPMKDNQHHGILFFIISKILSYTLSLFKITSFIVSLIGTEDEFFEERGIDKGERSHKSRLNKGTTKSWSTREASWDRPVDYLTTENKEKKRLSVDSAVDRPEAENQVLVGRSTGQNKAQDQRVQVQSQLTA